jgi:hypothetical protein
LYLYTFAIKNLEREKERSECTIPSNVPQFPTDHCFLGGSKIQKMSMEHWWNDTDWKTEVLGENPLETALSPPQISHGLIWN